MLKMLVYSFKNLFSKPATLKERTPPPKNYRGLIKYFEETCIYCKKCEMVCPPGAIIFTYPEDGSKKLKFHYNPYLCIYCGECVRACPKPGTLVQVEETAPPATAEERPNDRWFEVERLAVESKKKWQEARKRAREKKGQK